MGHRLGDHAQFLPAPRQTGQKVEQKHRCKEQGDQAGENECGGAALTNRCLQRRQEADCQKAGAEKPDAGEKRGERIDVAGGAALLDGLKDLTDRFTIVVGRAPRKMRPFSGFEGRPVCAGARVQSVVAVARCRVQDRRCDVVTGAGLIDISRGCIADAQRLLYGGEERPLSDL